MVNEGRWTLDYFSQLVETASSDEDGDGVMTENDRFGFFYQRDTLDAFLAAGQGALCEKDENDKPVYTMDTEKVIDILNAATDLMYNQNICFNVMNATGDFNEWMTNKFMGRRRYVHVGEKRQHSAAPHHGKRLRYSPHSEI